VRSETRKQATVAPAAVVVVGSAEDAALAGVRPRARLAAPGLVHEAPGLGIREPAALLDRRDDGCLPRAERAL
jgi:hypothetical protein